MNISIFDHQGATQYVNWVANETMNLSFTSEVPGGMTVATFDVPEEYRMPFRWADVFNQVEIYNGPTLVWSGYIWAVERYWEEAESGIRVDCVGWVAKLNDTFVVDNLSNEKGSTYITDHILSNTLLSPWVTAGNVSTSDYTIPGLREYQPFVSSREALDDIYSFNANTFTWYVWDKALYWEPIETTVTYQTNTENCVGSLRQELSEFGNSVLYSYRDLDGDVQYTAIFDTDTGYPYKAIPESYSDNMTGAQALQIATESLENCRVLGATAEISISRAWRLGGGEVHVSELKPGKLIHIDGLVTAKASPSEVFVDNDVDTFIIKSVTYDHTEQIATISPGRLPCTLPRVIAGKK